jgi:carbon storage regulator
VPSPDAAWDVQTTVGDGARRRDQESDLDGRGTPMLVLSRKVGEKVVIGDGVVLTVVKVERNQVRLGIEAPADVRVYREEIAPSRRQTAAVAVCAS